MKTTALLQLSAIIGLSLAVTGLCRADSYQVNAPAAYRLVGNQLDNPPNTLNTLFLALPSGAKATTHNPDTGYQNATKKGASAWSANLTVARGEAVYLQAGSPTTIPFSGTAMAAPVDLTTTIGFDPLNKYYLRASQICSVQDMTNAATRQYNYFEITGTTPLEGVAMYKQFPSGVPAPPATPATTPGAWDVHVFKFGAWSGGEPTIALGEGVWIGPEPTGTPVPWVFSTTPKMLSVDCGGTITVHGASFTPGATVELLPGPITCVGTVVNASGTEITATLPGAVAAGNYTLLVRNSATVASQPLSITVGPLKIRSSFPQFISPCTAPIITAVGGGFCPGATMIATPAGGGSPVMATSVTIASGGDLISGTFDFGPNPANSYDLTVQNPGPGATDTHFGAIFNGPQNYSFGWDYFSGLCGSRSITVMGTFCPGDEIRLVADVGGATLAGTVAALTPLPTGLILMTANFDMTGSSVGTYHPETRRGAGGWIPAAGKVTVIDGSICPIHVEFSGRTRVGYTRVNANTFTLRNVSCSTTPASAFTVSFPAADNPVFSAPTPSGAISPANVLTFNIPALAPGQAYLVTFSLQLPNLNTTCTLTAVDAISGCNAMIIPIDVVSSQDPNSKDGLPGHGADHAIAGDEMLPYEIHFENKPSATAPAQDVFVYDRLNPAQFDLSTFSLGEIKFGNRVITPPPGLTSYSEIVAHDVDGDPATTSDQMLLVVEGELVTDPASADLGRLTWSYRTLDPLTLASPLDPDLGFLPPNKLPPLGEGSVKFNVKLKPGVAAGVAMGSAAVIIFDANPPIATNPWFNQLATPVLLVIRQNADQVEIEWSGSPGTFTLEETTELGTAAVWTTVGTAPVSVAGGLQRVTLTPAGLESKYFRLRL